ncbi:lysine biosynthesis protein LysW [Streptomyces sp. G44]|uniref:lysine biosynthesis protein LysW n=1 Tax=Streptomyces sp. G44 TaxID=2807632 RepID=UPI001961C343|nr:lysine biosynthesis protein LysW [Streptomyces sp. G44]MBM7172719.1 lysine biosynthesis protein LysW [Streptomyces sp. G44]
MLACPECESDLALADQPKTNEIVECGGCAVELEVLTVDPVQVGLAPEVEEDWGE